MVSPMNDDAKLSFPAFDPDSSKASQQWVEGDHVPNVEKLEQSNTEPQIPIGDTTRNINVSRNRNKSSATYTLHERRNQRLEDDLQILRAERVVSNARNSIDSTRKSGSYVPRSYIAEEPVDDFDIDTQPIHEKARLYQPPVHPTTSLAKVLKRIHNSSFLVRWIIYITPVTLILSIPLFLGLLILKNTQVGGLRFFWIGVWLEVIWLTLWLARLVAKSIPWPMGLISSLLTNNSKKWKILGKTLEVPATMLLWVIAIEISFIHITKKYHININSKSANWEKAIHKIILSAIVGAAMNFVEKIIIQLIAMNFHFRTYADRIEINKFQIQSLIKLYIYSKERITMKDSEFELSNTSGSMTPMAYVNLAGKNVRHVFTKVTDVAGKVAGDFTGQAVQTSTHPRQVVLQLINTNNGSQVLARRLYRTFAQDARNTVLPDDLKPAFDNEEEAHAAFSMFDKDLNGDISMEELEAVCVEIGRERKGITASLKDLDAVVSKLDQVFLFIVSIITILVFLSLISASASVILTSAGSTILALSWLLQATAQEFLQSIIFVFVKHPFDVGDRVTIYGNTGKTLTGDDYFVKGISLLYTEFKKMEGQIVQAPNSYLNTIFILNQRRSGGLAEAIPVTVKFGTTLEQIDALRQRLLEFVTLENREYQQNILTELTTIYEAYSVTLNVVFFYKSNWQNELLRLQRRNKFICAMMVSMNELGIEGPRMLLAGAAEEYPLYLHGAYPNAYINSPASKSGSFSNTPEVSNITSSNDIRSHTPPIIPRSRQDIMKLQRGESFLDVKKHTDISLGISSINSSTNYADAFTDHEPIRLPSIINPSSRTYHSSTDRIAMARTSSRDSIGSSNKRRFMSLRRKHPSAHDESTRSDDLEAGTPTPAMHDIAEGRS